MKDSLKVGVEGHIKVIDRSRNTLVMSKRNAVHAENMSILLAAAMADRDTNGSIHYMAFGSGGATVDNLGNVIFSPPNISGNASLYNEVVRIVVNDNAGAPAGNQMAVYHQNGTMYSFVEVRGILGPDLPSDQPITNNYDGTNINNDNFAFDEIGLMTETGLLVTHATFTPIVKASNVTFEVIYTLKVSIS